MIDVCKDFYSRVHAFIVKTVTPEVVLSLTEVRRLASGNQLVEKAFLSVIKPAQHRVKHTLEQQQTVANGPSDYHLQSAVCPSIARPCAEAPGRAGTSQNQARTDGRNQRCVLRHRRAGVCVQQGLACCLQGKCTVYHRDLLSVAGQQVRG